VSFDFDIVCVLYYLMAMTLCVIWYKSIQKHVIRIKSIDKLKFCNFNTTLCASYSLIPWS